MGRSAHVLVRAARRYSLADGLAGSNARRASRCQPTIAVVDTGANLRVPAARRGAACALRRPLAQPGRARPERPRNAGRRAHRARETAAHGS